MMDKTATKTPFIKLICVSYFSVQLVVKMIYNSIATYLCCIMNRIKIKMRKPTDFQYVADATNQ